MRAARLVRRINRAKAEKLLADFLRCVEEVNAHPDLLHWVTEVRVIGSYLTNSDDLGDIEIAIKKEARPVSGSLSDARVAFYSQRLVARLLKGGSRYISVHGVTELDESFEFGGKTFAPLQRTCLQSDAQVLAVMKSKLRRRPPPALCSFSVCGLFAI
jgi:hypothetical protein